MADVATLWREQRTGVAGALDLTKQAIIRNTAGARLRARQAEADRAELVAELTGLRAEDARPLDLPDFKTAAKEDNAHPAVMHTLGNVEGGISGFYTGRIIASDGSAIEDPGKLVPLVEPHIFSALTSHAWDKLRPDISYPNWIQNKKGAPPPPGWERHPYQYNYDDRWGLFAAMAEVDPMAAIGSVSLGRFQQICGSPRPSMGWKLLKFPSCEALFRELAKSERHQLEIMRRFFRANGAMGTLQAVGRAKTAADRLPNWRELARVYNGAGQVEKYSKLLEAEYLRVLRYYG